jgi:hypothetical protein
METDVSLLLGPMSPKEAASKVLRGGDEEGVGVRRTTVGKLRQAGFVVAHTPNRRNRDHVSVSLERAWTDDDSNSFSSCFEQPIWEGEGG